MFLMVFAAFFGAYLAALLLAPTMPPGFFWGLSSLLMPAIEIAAAVFTSRTLLIALRRYHPWLAALSAVIPLALLTAIYFSQFASLYLSGGYLTALALENMREIQFIRSPTLTASIAALVILFAGITLWLAGSAPDPGPKRPVLRMLGLVTLWVLAVAQVDASSRSSEIVDLQPDLSPASALYRAHRSVRLAEIEAQALATYAARARRGDYAGIAAFDPDLPQPFRRVTDFTAPLPFPGTVPDGVRPNIVVIFMEGFSARLMESYGGRIPGLTPNLDAQAGRFMLVDDYFGHSAATYRGIIGQVSSGHLRHGGAHWEEGFGTDEAGAAAFGRTLPEILGERGYETVFLTPDHPENPWVGTLGTIGYEQVYHFDNIAELLGTQPQEEPPVPGVPDRDMMAALRAFLSRHDGSAPVFLGVYNAGTHAFMDTPDGKQRFGTGDNAMLNRMHEYDTAIAPFLDAFFASPRAQDTILIITADHATYPEPPTVAAFDGADYAPYFIGRIPLMIHSPYHDLPGRFDAGTRTSVDFAPSLLHLLGLTGVDHAFLGASIFDRSWSPGLQVSAIGNDLYALGGPRHVERLADTPLTEAQARMEDVIRYYYAIQRRGALFQR